MELHLRVPPCAPPAEVAAFILRCEEAGLEGVGVVDSQLLVRDTFVAMGAAAERTERIRMAAAVTNPVTRHPSVLASAARTVDEMAPGRTAIWLGRGYSSVRTIGEPPATLARMRESVGILIALLAGQTVTFPGGASSKLRHAGGGAVPIYVAATGPRGIELAGEVADGALLNVGLHPNNLARARELLAAGAARSGRDPGTLDVVFCASVVLHDDLAAAREQVRPICVQRLMEPHHRHWYDQAGIDLEGREIPKGLWELYPDVPHAEDWARAQQLCSFLPDKALGQMCDIMGLIGPPEHCLRRLRDLEAAGIDRLYLMTPETYTFPERELLAFEETILPALSG